MENKNIYETWISRSMASVHMAIAIVSAFMYAVSCVGDFPGFHDGSIILFTIGVLHFFLHANLNRQYHFLYDNRNVKSLPKKKIRRLNMRYILQYLLGCIAVIALVVEIEAGHIFLKVKDLILTFLAKILNFFFERGEIETGDVDPEYRFAFLNKMDGNESLNRGIGDHLISVVQGVLIVIGLVIIIALIGLTLYRVLRKFFFGATETGRRIEIRESRDVFSELQKEKTIRLSRWSKDPSVRIRRRYKKEISKLRKEVQDIPASMTPGEIEQMVGIPETDEYQKLHDYYEKARYSNAGCTAADYEKFKDLQFKR